MTSIQDALRVICVFLAGTVIASVQSADAKSSDEAAISDGSHYSTVFAGHRNYRIFTPPSYATQTSKRYPVIYFFHGWNQRYFGSMGKGYADYDKGDQNGGDNIQNFVSKNDVIVVKVDGLNTFSIDPQNLSPYNVSTVTTFRQFPTYFKEFVRYIDSHYRTIPDREHRAVSGLSMGGFMTFWLAAKYPDMISAAGNFCGSTEFMAGPLEFPTEYAHAEMFDNVRGVSVRMHNGTRDRLRFYHQDFNRYWLNVVPQYEFQAYDASHTTCGLHDMFTFIMDAFESPLPVPSQWDHIDIYPSFEVWDYQVETNRARAGFTILENVNRDGFKVAVQNFLPDGQRMPHVSVTIKTAPIYMADQRYRITDVTDNGMTHRTSNVTSDAEGRLTIVTDGGLHHIAINGQDPLPNLCISQWTIDNMPWAETDKEIHLSIDLLNKGTADANAITGTIIPISEGLEVLQGTGTLQNLRSLSVDQLEGSLTVKNNKRGIEIAKFGLQLKDESGHQWQEEFELRLKDPVPEINDFEIADGRLVTVVQAAVESVSGIVGVGNGDGIANPGEAIVILVKDDGKYLRTNASTLHPKINADNNHIRVSDSWQEFDHIGGSSKYTQPVIASKESAGKSAWFYVEYWLPGKISGQHLIKKGKVRIDITGQDKTPPQLQWIQMSTDDRIEARVYDGAGVDKVTLTLVPNTEKSTIPHVQWDAAPETFEVELVDTGTDGDAAKGDGVFSRKIKNRPSYFFDLKVKMVDERGNSQSDDSLGTIFLKNTQ
ncbi:Carbohydrate acetyl esterase/feruloyl esterase precursor [Rubripirellula lacrimiformis]|uniref:Carbohydrate acetyl esterase/feruloyl esterase n=1 Tax=Rubripirellula lacrimiformis TaxID=1930273 RepID=A0A517NJ61_9BACT|nr:alpha/beta hydrolase-fold protein [Rubripirellula lacrimiformis]QDT07073.1 Carbohydrate acetyl esterase/feruloyl esterase precursor [Rubripirellula lacrimiformis]